jgi:hypothetical protein
MAPKTYTTVRLDSPARDNADRLRAALRSESGLRTSRDEIVRALVWGVTPPQAAGMLSAYVKHAESGSGVGES